jgi:hypothetical protein
VVHRIARWLRDEEAAGSNPATPTKEVPGQRTSLLPSVTDRSAQVADFCSEVGANRPGLCWLSLSARRPTPPASVTQTTCLPVSARPRDSSRTLPVDLMREPRMSRSLRSAPAASSRSLTATANRSACAPSDGTLPLALHTLGELPAARPGRTVSGRAFPRSAREPQIRLTPPPRRAPPGPRTPCASRGPGSGSQSLCR